MSDCKCECLPCNKDLLGCNSCDCENCKCNGCECAE